MPDTGKPPSSLVSVFYWEKRGSEQTDVDSFIIKTFLNVKICVIKSNMTPIRFCCDENKNDEILRSCVLIMDWLSDSWDNLWPLTPCSCCLSGFYMYIETSRPRLEGDKARLLSPTFNMNSKTSSSSVTNNPTYCFAFYYHMYGKHIGERTWGNVTSLSNDIKYMEVYSQPT